MKIAPRKNRHGKCTEIRLFPITSHICNYTRAKFADDMRAGFNVAVLSFPINMAYAMVAGLPISYGIFCGIVAALVGLCLSKGAYIALGPSNSTAVMLLSSFSVAGLATEAARTAALPNILIMAALFLMFISAFKLTFWISYISRTVIIGYVTSASLLIIANQARNIFGFSYAEGVVPITFVDTVLASFKSASSSSFSSVFMAALTLAFFLPLKKFCQKIPAEAAALILVGIACWLGMEFFGAEPERLQAVSAAEWKISAPDFSALGVKQSASLALAVALMALIEAFSIGKSLASQKADRLSTNQEIFALGASNLACAFTSGTVCSGSMTRSTLMVNSGAKTPIFNLSSAAFTLLILLLFGSLICYVPKAALATIVVCTTITMIRPRAIRIALKSTPSDAIVFLSTFLTGIFSTLDDAIFVGIIVSILLFLKKAASPEVVEYSIGDHGELEIIADKSKPRHDPEISIVHVEGNMFFGASDVLQNQLRRLAAEPNLKVLILKLRNAINLDATSVMDLEELARRMRSTKRRLILCEVRDDLMNILKRSGACASIGKNNIFGNDDSNPTLSAALAIKSARKGMGEGVSPKLSIYAPKKSGKKNY